MSAYAEYQERLEQKLVAARAKKAAEAKRRKERDAQHARAVVAAREAEIAVHITDESAQHEALRAEFARLNDRVREIRSALGWAGKQNRNFTKAAGQLLDGSLQLNPAATLLVAEGYELTQRAIAVQAQLREPKAWREHFTQAVHETVTPDVFDQIIARARAIAKEKR